MVTWVPTSPGDKAHQASKANTSNGRPRNMPGMRSGSVGLLLWCNSRLFWRCLACVSWAVVFGLDDWPTIGSLVRLGFRLAPAGPLHRVRSLCNDMALLLCLATCSSLVLPSRLSSLISLSLFCSIFCGRSLSLLFFLPLLLRAHLPSLPPFCPHAADAPRGVQRLSAWKVDKATSLDLFP